MKTEPASQHGPGQGQLISPSISSPTTTTHHALPTHQAAATTPRSCPCSCSSSSSPQPLPPPHLGTTAEVPQTVYSSLDAATDAARGASLLAWPGDEPYRSPVLNHGGQAPR
ncbi:hypothetical protein QBC33DRAFT_553831 [Phialemonium atrogriseum]|uniref:Uncharacterized protein n=1 Tax=Phialemonium atrogriseum TaxID=1093897 RepID=A0AAJ0FRF9_9PEZI|nr:uncharacterized protein QBC33DRAFT_553831 [Phialemonium atrogriseum]KAK1772379.1 hypothetical protein QBC33DRAFT_553831 [Phialemonium atrogriseum]